MQCRVDCGACCIAPSISSAIPGMPHGKPAGVRCIQLDKDNRCLIFGKPERPAVCVQLKPETAMCGAHREHALRFLAAMETASAPNTDFVARP
jgi:Fe-S-cluster containining protein